MTRFHTKPHTENRPTRLLTKEGVAAITGQHRETIMRLAKEGRFPRPIRLGPTDKHPVRFVESEVLAWIAARIAERDGVTV